MFKLEAALKSYIWGGTRLKDEFQKHTSLDRVSESWELSCHEDGKSVIKSGEFCGMSLADYFTQNKWAMGEKQGDFPILIKLIDARDNLSVQVHPNDEDAKRLEGANGVAFGKTEMWYIVDCDEGASLIYGFKHEISRDEFKQRIAADTILEVCNIVPVKKGDVFFIEAGTLHAICGGILIAEIQQNSNTTYRIYDYGRVDANGNPRELHIEKAVQVTNLCKASNYPVSTVRELDGYSSRCLSRCKHFSVDLLCVQTCAELHADASSFHSLLCLEGNFLVDDLVLSKGESIFVEATHGDYTIIGKGEIILTRLGN